MNKMKEPKHFMIFRFVGFLLLFGGITLIILGAVVFRTGRGAGDNAALIVPGIFSCILSIPSLLIGFATKINKMHIDSIKYIQEENKENIKEIANNSADIVAEPLSKVVKSIKQENKKNKYCKECGASIDLDSKFCKSCGKKL
jgi:hypothetical protein